MSGGRLHADEVAIDAALVGRLVASRFPHWAPLPLARVDSSGTDHVLYRLGGDMVVRLPRTDGQIGQAEVEQRWLPRLAPRLPLEIPEQLAVAPPSDGYPFPWSVYRWLDGEPATLDRIASPGEAALELARFVRAMHRVDITGGDAPGDPDERRGAPLATRDASTREAIAELADLFDPAGLIRVWEDALQCPAWPGPPVLLHGDLLPTNMLVRRGRLTAVIDFGSMSVGDPACDVMAAWTVLPGSSRAAFRDALRVDDATWGRGRGWALSWAAIYIPYYRDTDPDGAAMAVRTIEQVLTDTDVRASRL